MIQIPLPCKFYKINMINCISLQNKMLMNGQNNNTKCKCDLFIEQYQICMHRQKKIINTNNPCK